MVGTVRLVESNANNVFSSVASMTFMMYPELGQAEPSECRAARPPMRCCRAADAVNRFFPLAICVQCVELNAGLLLRVFCGGDGVTIS